LSNKPKIFTRTRIANVMSAYVIAFGLWVIVFNDIPVSSLAILSGIMGFAAKHLWDSCVKD